MKWMKIDAACQHAGGLERKMLYAAVAAGDLEVRRVGNGRNMLFTDVWIDAWLLSLPKVRQPEDVAGEIAERSVQPQCDTHARPRIVTPLMERAS